MDPLRRRPPQETLDWVADSVGRESTIVSIKRLTEGHWHANHIVAVEQAGMVRDFVLRRWARPEWKDEDPDFTAAREADALELLADAAVPTPRVIAVDSDGEVCDVPAILTDRLPGRPPERDPEDLDSFLRQLAEALPPVHAVDGPRLQRIPGYRRYFENLGSSVPPTWAQKPDLWERATEVIADAPPPGRRCFIHRDYHPGNTLWSDGRLTGVVDWTSASVGSPSVDTAHIRWNLAVAYGLEAAEKFLETYRSLSNDTDQDQHYWDVVTMLDVVRDLDPSDLPPTWKIERFDQYLESVLGSVG